MASRLLHETPDMARLISALFLVLFANAALAQSTQVITQPLIIRGPNSDFEEQISFGPSKCDMTYSVRWKYTSSLGVACSGVTFWSTTATICGDAPVSGDVTYPEVSQAVLTVNPTGTFDVKVAELPGFKAQTLADGGVTTATSCGGLNQEIEHLVCGSAAGGTLGVGCGFGGTTPPKLKASPLKLKYDTKPPTAPEITDAIATNGTAILTHAVNADAVFVIPVVTEVLDGGTGATTEQESRAAENNKVKVTGLTNGTTYNIQLKFVDLAGNVGPLSDSRAVTPIPTFGFWGAYQAVGGTDTGGCSVSWGLMPILAALLFMMRRASR